MKWPRFPQIFPATPPHTEPREWRASVALISSIFGSIALTGFSGALVGIMWKGGWAENTAEARVHVLGSALMLSLAGSLVVLITLGFAINRRSIKVNRDGIEAVGGGDDDPTPSPVVTTTTTTTVPSIAPIVVPKPA